MGDMAKNVGIVQVSKHKDLGFDNIDLLGKNQMLEVIKDVLFDKARINMITDLSGDEANLITRIHGTSELKDLKTWDSLLDYYMELRLSKNRMSRKETLQAIAGLGAKKGFADKLRGLFRGDD